MIVWDRIEPVMATSVEGQKQTPELLLMKQLEKATSGGNTTRLRDLQYPEKWVLLISESDDLFAKAQEALKKAGKFGVMFSQW